MCIKGTIKHSTPDLKTWISMRPKIFRLTNITNDETSKENEVKFELMKTGDRIWKNIKSEFKKSTISWLVVQCLMKIKTKTHNFYYYCKK